MSSFGYPISIEEQELLSERAIFIDCSIEANLKKKCLCLGLVFGPDDFKLCMQSK